MQMRSYEAARSYFSILGFLSWCVIVLGGIVAIGALVAVGQASRSFGGSPMAGVAGLVPGAGIMFFGFLGLVVVQIGRAGVDSAEYAQQSLKIAREQLEISRQTLEQGAGSSSPGYAPLQAAKEDLKASFRKSGFASASGFDDSERSNGGTKFIKTDGEIFKYRGKTIEAGDGHYLLDGKVFETLESAKAFLDHSHATTPSVPPAATTEKPQSSF